MHKHRVTFKGSRRPMTLRDVRPGEFFAFIGESTGLNENGLMARTWSDEDDTENGAYCFIQVSNPENIWSGAKGSPVLDYAVRVLQAGEAFTVRIGVGL